MHTDTVELIRWVECNLDKKLFCFLFLLLLMATGGFCDGQFVTITRGLRYSKWPVAYSTTSMYIIDEQLGGQGY